MCKRMQAREFLKCVTPYGNTGTPFSNPGPPYSNEFSQPNSREQEEEKSPRKNRSWGNQELGQQLRTEITEAGLLRLRTPRPASWCVTLQVCFLATLSGTTAHIMYTAWITRPLRSTVSMSLCLLVLNHTSSLPWSNKIQDSAQNPRYGRSSSSSYVRHHHDVVSEVHSCLWQSRWWSNA